MPALPWVGGSQGSDPGSCRFVLGDRSTCADVEETEQGRLQLRSGARCERPSPLYVDLRSRSRWTALYVRLDAQSHWQRCHLQHRAVDVEYWAPPGMSGCVPELVPRTAELLRAVLAVLDCRLRGSPVSGAHCAHSTRAPGVPSCCLPPSSPGAGEVAVWGISQGHRRLKRSLDNSPQFQLPGFSPREQTGTKAMQAEAITDRHPAAASLVCEDTKPSLTDFGPPLH